MKKKNNNKNIEYPEQPTIVEIATLKLVTDNNKKIRGIKVIGKDMSRETIIDFINKWRAKKEEKTKKRLLYQVTLKYDDRPYAGEWFDITEPVDLYTKTDGYDDVEPDIDQPYYNEFWLYYRPLPPMVGGCDNGYNDCLYHCLKLLATKDLPWAQPSTFKKFLKLKRDEKVNINLIKQVEDKLEKYQINVTGDHEYISTNNKKLKMNLILRNGHYTVNHELGYHDILNNFKISFKERIPIIINKISKTKFIAFDNNGERELSKKEYYEIMNLKTPYIYVPYEGNEDLKTCYFDFIETADKIKKETNGIINLYKCGSYANCAVRLFEYYTKAIKPDAITPTEALWFQRSTHGGIYYNKGEYKGKLYSYDFKSHYPSIMINVNFMVPILAGEFKILEELDFEKINYGIYRVKITKTDNMPFRLNKHSYYTSIDIKKAKELNYDIELIQDGTANALLYDRSKCLTGSEVFNKTISYLYELKNSGECKTIYKIILNSLWGKLCQALTRSRKTKQTKEYTDENGMKHTEHEIHDKEGDNIKHVIHEEKTIKVSNANKVFFTHYARIKPFLLAKGRDKILSAIMSLDNLNDLIRCNIDSIYSKSELKYKDLGDKIGQLDYKGFCNNAINDSHKVNGEFKI